VQKTAFFGPKAATSQPLIKVPKIEPTPVFLVIMQCENREEESVLT
jgi:hypothetical protein